MIVTLEFFALGGEAFERGREIVSGWLLLIRVGGMFSVGFG